MADSGRDRRWPEVARDVARDVARTLEWPGLRPKETVTCVMHPPILGFYHKNVKKWAKITLTLVCLVLAPKCIYMFKCMLSTCSSSICRVCCWWPVACFISAVHDLDSESGWQPRGHSVFQLDHKITRFGKRLQRDVARSPSSSTQRSKAISPTWAAHLVAASPPSCIREEGEHGSALRTSIADEAWARPDQV